MRRTSVLFSCAALTVLVACGGGGSSVKTATAPGGSKDPNAWPADDHSMCKTAGRTDIEISEIAGGGALKPNVRRVFRVTGGGGSSAHRILECREVDTNLDGIKDTVRRYDERGAPTHEEADRNYDGRIDSWTDFVGGRLAEVSTDTNGDGKPDVWTYYTDGTVQRVRRDRNFDGRADVWEIYANGRLERMGTDETFDGHVDRWDRDGELKRQADLAEEKARADMNRAESEARGEAGTEADAGAADASAPSK